MDPITVATKRFLRELDRLWKRDPSRMPRLIARPDDRSQVIKALRIGEYSPSSRRPLFLYEAAFTTAEVYFAGLVDRASADYDLVRKGAEEEGVALAPLSPPARTEGLAPEAHAMTLLIGVADRLAVRLDGALVVLIPKLISDAAQWRRSIERLRQTSRPSSLRIAVFDPEEGHLATVLGEDGARLSFTMDELFDFAQQQINKKSEGPAPPPGPALSAEQRTEFERSIGHRAATPETAVRLQTLFLEGARVTAKSDFKAAAAAYRSARDLCHDEGLTREEVAATFALGGAYLASGSRPMAQATYGQAALLAAQELLWGIACRAKLGEAGVGWIEKEFGRAARAYAEAASLAERGEIVPLRIEALRMEGLCHQHRGAEAEAIQAWRRAIDVGTAADEPARRASTFPEVVTALADLLERHGLRPQADHVRTLIESR